MGDADALKKNGALLQGALGFKLMSAAFVASTYGPPIGRRCGFGIENFRNR